MILEKVSDNRYQPKTFVINRKKENGGEGAGVIFFLFVLCLSINVHLVYILTYIFNLEIDKSIFSIY